MKHKIVGLISVILVACFTGAVAQVSHAGDLEGAWELTSYELNGSSVPVSGSLIFSGGEFGMIYVMGDDRPMQFGRAHAGLYEVHGDRLTFDVRSWVQRTADATGIISGKVVAADMEWQDGGLVLRFEGGSVQELRPLDAADARLVSGSWKLAGGGNAKSGASANGLLIAAENRYVLLHLDNDAQTGAAYGGTVEADGTLDSAWAISVEGKTGTVAVADPRTDLEFVKLEDSVEVQDAEDNRLLFSSE